MYNRRDNASQKAHTHLCMILTGAFFVDLVYLLFGLSISCIHTRIVGQLGLWIHSALTY